MCEDITEYLRCIFSRIMYNANRSTSCTLRIVEIERTNDGSRESAGK